LLMWKEEVLLHMFWECSWA